MRTTLLGLNKINTTIVQVSEPIVKNSLLEFLFTSTNHSMSDYRVKFLYHYFESSKNYFIASFKTKDKSAILLPQVLKSYYKYHDSSLFDLFITSDFFALFSHQELLCFKSFSHKASNDEIVRYVEHTYKLSIGHVIEVSNTELIKYEKEYKQNQQPQSNYTYLKTWRYLASYIFYCFVVAFCVGFVLGFIEERPKHIQAVKATVPVKQLQSQQLVSLFESLSAQDIQLLKFSLTQDVATMRLAHSNKQRLIAFLKSEKLSMKTLNYVNESQAYEVTATSSLL